jgi:hypothetical protein
MSAGPAQTPTGSQAATHRRGAAARRALSRHFWSEDRLREAMTMALYVSLVLCGEFVTLRGHLESAAFALSVIWGTAVGLTLAHVFAFNLAGMLVEREAFRRQAPAVAIAQVLAAGAVAVALSLPFAVLDLSQALTLDQYIVAGFIGGTGWGIAHAAGRSGLQALAVGFFMLALGVAVVLVKAALSAH